MAEPPRLVYIQTPEQWEGLRPLITKLYTEDGLELPALMKEVEKTGFKANPGMFKQRFKKWGLTKYHRQHEVEIILRVKRDREALGKQTSFLLRGREVDMVDLERYRRRKNIEIPNIPVTVADLETVPDLTYITPPTSPSSEPESAGFPTPSSSDSYSDINSNVGLDVSSNVNSQINSNFYLDLYSLRRLPRAVFPPTALGHCEEFLQNVTVSFELFITFGIWDLSKSTEMPWSARPVVPTTEPVMAEYYWQDECSRHLTNGVMLAKRGDMNLAYKEWNAALYLIQFVVQAAHYNTLGKLLACIHLLEQERLDLLSKIFRAHIGFWAQKKLKPDHPYVHLYGRLRHLQSEDIEALQQKTQELLVEKLETFLGVEAFTSFEHKLVLNEKRLEQNPSLDIDAWIPTNEECSRNFGPTSSKTMLALNMRNGIFQHRGALDAAHDTCWTIIKNASMVEDPAKMLWHLGSAWISLARLQSKLGQPQAMRSSLTNAMAAEQKLRDDHGLIKLGEGELNWIFEELGSEPIFRPRGADELEIESLSLT